VDKLRAIDDHASALGRPARVHLKIDTGMERIGVHWYSAEALLEESLKCRHLHVEGIFTHFANADDRDLTHARLQLERFAEVLSFYERRSLPMPLRHAANSGAILQLPESHFDLVRPGILFYGAAPSPEVRVTIPGMDQMMVSIGMDSAYNGDEAVLLGDAGGASISIEDLASWAGTIPHEVLTSINTRVPRVYLD
jgi:alanine racemase